MPLDFPTKAALEVELSEWKTLLPKVQDAYRPSGIVPVEAYPAMLVGGTLAIPVAIVAAGVVSAIAAVVMLFLTYVIAFLFALPVLFYIIVLVVAVVWLLGAFCGWLFTYFTLGGICGLGVSMGGRRTKNRGRVAAGAFGLLTGAASVLGYFLFAQWMSDYLGRADLASLFGHGFPGLGEYHFGIIAWGNVLFGLPTAAITAAITGARPVKFCESCEEFMDGEKLRPVAFEAGQNVVTELVNGRLRGALDAYRALDDGGPITPQVFRCPRCGKGYLELNVAFERRYQGPKDKSPSKVSEDWLCASSPVSPDEAAAFLDKGKLAPRAT
jgi:energy-coupling factor transporter transmembrane protein EcfT